MNNQIQDLHSLLYKLFIYIVLFVSFLYFLSFSLKPTRIPNCILISRYIRAQDTKQTGLKNLGENFRGKNCHIHHSNYFVTTKGIQHYYLLKTKTKISKTQQTKRKCGAIFIRE
jgi:hypothetical protein